jgi:hypothetical protein
MSAIKEKGQNKKHYMHCLRSTHRANLIEVSSTDPRILFNLSSLETCSGRKINGHLHSKHPLK